MAWQVNHHGERLPGDSPRPVHLVVSDDGDGQPLELGTTGIRFAWALRPAARSHGLLRDAAGTPCGRVPHLKPP